METEIPVQNQRVSCWTCYRPRVSCLCPHITKFSTQTYFVLLMHPREHKKERIGTGRITHVSLTNSQVIVDVDFTQNKMVNQLIQDESNFCVLLYPGTTSLNVSKGEFDQRPLKDKRLVVFILDGTWTCAKKMLGLSHNLRSLTRLMFESTMKSQFYIKQQPHPQCLSTIETTFELLKALTKQGLEASGDWDKLLIPFQKMQEYQVQCAMDPAKSRYRGGKYKTPEEKGVANYQRKRSVFFNREKENE